MNYNINVLQCFKSCENEFDDLHASLSEFRRYLESLPDPSVLKYIHTFVANYGQLIETHKKVFIGIKNYFAEGSSPSGTTVDEREKEIACHFISTLCSLEPKEIAILSRVFSSAVLDVDESFKSSLIEEINQDRENTLEEILVRFKANHSKADEELHSTL